MLSRGSLVFLALAAGACFSDSLPGGLSTASGTSTAGASTTAVTTGGSGTTGGSATGDASTMLPTSTHTTEPGTSEATSTTTPATGPDSTATTNAGTSTTATGPDSSSASTGPSGFEMCEATRGRYECYTCCIDATPDIGPYLDVVVQCVCGQLPCGNACESTLCQGLTVNEACFDRISPLGAGECFVAATNLCKADRGCAPYYECLGGAGCSAKPD